LAAGIKDSILDWIKGFLLNRKQRVVMGDSVTDWVKVTSGVTRICARFAIVSDIYQ
jgi:hypothetical protein